MCNDLLTQTRELLATTALSREQVSNASGVPVSTINKIAGGFSPNPRIKSLQPIYNYLQNGELPTPAEAS